MFLHDFLSILGLNLGIESVVRNDLDNRALFAETEATGANNLGKIIEPLVFDFGAEMICQQLAVGRFASCASANQ
jgi:hypothetical protein